jgi:hypothetical protein
MTTPKILDAEGKELTVGTPVAYGNFTGEVTSVHNERLGVEHLAVRWSDQPAYGEDTLFPVRPRREDPSGFICPCLTLIDPEGKEQR